MQWEAIFKDPYGVEIDHVRGSVEEIARASAEFIETTAGDELTPLPGSVEFFRVM